MQICTTEKTYTCECGKLFSNPQSFNGHKSHCKIHCLAKGDQADYDAYLLKQAKASAAAQKARRSQISKEQDVKQKAWLEAKHKCEHCGLVMTEKFGSGRFCSRACANSRSHSTETRQKIRDSLSQTLVSQQRAPVASKRVCSVCGTKIKGHNKTGLCQSCLRYSSEGITVLSALGKKGYATKQERGTHKGWQSRNIISYAEQFWMQVLDNNNIEYKREVPVKHDKSNYFLDFVIEHNGKLIDLEIDGKQHTYEDRIQSDVIRDLYLTRQGYLVYRVAWNEIKSKAGADEMKEKIDAFLAFYNSL